MPADAPVPPGTPSTDTAETGTGVLSRTLRHDLLNALNAVRGYAELLVADLPEGQHRAWAVRVLAASMEATDLSERLPRAPAETAPTRPLLLAARPDRAGLIAGLVAGLEAAGWEVAHAIVAREAVAVLRAAPAGWVAVLVDDHLPDAASVLAAARAGGLAAVATDLGEAGVAGALKALAGG